ADGDATLVGKRVPQVPRRQGSLEVAWDGGWTRASLRGRWASEAFDDDRNAFSLGGLSVVDLSWSVRLPRGAEVFVAVENALDADYLAARTPLPSVGSPRLARLGVRWSLPGR